MTSSELMLLVVLNGMTAITAFAVVLVRPVRMPFLLALALSHFSTVTLVTIWLVVSAGGMALFYSIGIALFGLIGSLLGGGAGELMRAWLRRHRTEEIITIQGSLEHFATFERFYAELATRKAEIDSLTELSGVREAEAANPRWADLVDAGTLNRLRQSDAGALESLLGGIFAGRYTLGELSFHRGVGSMAYVPAKRSLGAETLPLKMLLEMFGFEVVGDTREEGN